MILFKIVYHVNSIIRTTIFKLIFGKKFRAGKKFSFRKGFSLIIEGPEASVQIGNNCFFNNFCTIAAMSKITIGDFSIFGENVKIYDHNHLYKDIEKPIQKQGFSMSAITIGKNCWVASNVIILKGVTIGDNCIIGAGCIVHKNVPDNSILICKQEQIVKEI